MNRTVTVPHGRSSRLRGYRRGGADELRDIRTDGRDGPLRRGCHAVSHRSRGRTGEGGTRPNPDALVSTLAGAKPSTSNAAPQACRSAGARCSQPGLHKGGCCVECSWRGRCCSAPFKGDYCTSHWDCCDGHGCLTMRASVPGSATAREEPAALALAGGGSVRPREERKHGYDLS